MSSSTTPLDDVTQELLAALRLMPEFEHVSEPNDEVNEYPYGIVYPGSGDWLTTSSDGGNGRPTIGGEQTFNIEVFVPYNDLQTAIERLRPFPDKVTLMLYGRWTDNKFNRKIRRLIRVRWELTKIMEDTIGYRFQVVVDLGTEVPSVTTA